MTLNRLQIEEMYIQGTDLEVPNPSDPEGGYTLFIRKMNPNQQQIAVRKANAAQIKMKKLISSQDDPDELLIFENEVDEIGGREEHIEHISLIHAAGERAKVEQEVSAEDEWSEEGYLQSLVDSWTDEMQADLLKEDDADPETKRIFEEMQRFSESVNTKVEVIQKLKVEELNSLSDGQVRLQILKDTIERAAGMEWLRVFRDYQILYGIEDPSNHERIYAKIEEVQALPLALYKIYVQGITDMSLPVTDLK